MTLVSDIDDPCEWNPNTGRAAWSDDVGHAQAEVIVGANGQWRLCRACAALPVFRRFRVRKDTHEWTDADRREARQILGIEG